MQRRPFEQVELGNLVGPLKTHLQEHFKNVECEVVECPDLTSFGVVNKGFGGQNIIVDIGGENNLHYVENNSVVFDVKQIQADIQAKGEVVLGPGAGSKTKVGVLTELMYNNDLQRDNKSKSCKIDNDTYKLENYPYTETGMLANLLFTEGKQGGPVIKIVAKTRTGNTNFYSCVRNALNLSFKQSIGLFGVSRIHSGAFKAHVMPDFCGKDLLNQPQVDEWLRFFEIEEPATLLSVLISNPDPELNIRAEHTHFWGDRGAGGHYHHDTTPDTIHYEAYFVLADEFVRYHRPVIAKERTALFQK